MPEGAAVARYVSEFVGTYLVVLTVGCNVLVGSSTWAALSIGSVLMVATYALAASSGANFNPAVSLSLGLTGKMGWDEVSIYALVQLVGGGLAAGTYIVLFGENFALGPSRGYDPARAAVTELLYTFMLCFVYLSVVTSKKHADKDQFFGLAIGAVIVAGGYAGGHISGACFNPAVAFGIDASNMKLTWFLIYSVVQLLGAGLASVVYSVVRPDDFTPKVIDNYPLVSKLTAEFVGVYLLVLTVGLNVLGQSPAGALSIAAAVVCMIFSLGSCSGAHINPAVTLAIVASGRSKLRPVEGVWYIFVQLLAGICGAFTYSLLEHGKTFPLGPGPGFSWGTAGMAELLFTFLYCFVVLCCCTTVIGLSQFYGLAVGACVVAGGLAIGPVSGAALNPSISTGIAVSHLMNGGGILGLLLYTGAHLAGASLAALSFMATHPSEYSKLPM